MLVDSHAHLDMPQFEQDLPRILERAKEAAVEYIITVGSDLPSSKQAVKLAEQHERIYAAVGIHPHDAKTVTEDTCQILAGLAYDSDKVMAIGETGLDYHYDNSPRDIQRQVFKRQLELANQLELPVIVHSREADEDTLAILEDMPVRKKGVMHCFSGDRGMLEKCLEMGFYISLAGPVTFPKAQALRHVAKFIPNERLMIETDCPYLAPVPWRGKRNEPSYLVAIAQKVAELKGLSLEDIARITSLNVCRLFGINGADTRSKIAYPIRDSLYLNITNRCTNNCTFCARQSSYYVQGHNLYLEKEPKPEEIIAALPEDLSLYREVVFCGFGEPFLRLDVLLSVAKYLKTKGMKVRVNSNGQASLIYGRNIVPELVGLVDMLSISINTPDSVQYQEICKSQYGQEAYMAIMEFIRLAVYAGIQVTVTALDMPGIDLTACAEVAQQLGVPLRTRSYNMVG